MAILNRDLDWPWSAKKPEDAEAEDGDNDEEVDQCHFFGDNTNLDNTVGYVIENLIFENELITLKFSFNLIY